MSDSEIIFTLQESRQAREQSIAFAHRIAYQWYQCFPSDTPEYLFSAKSNENVIATVGITTHNENLILPIRNSYNISLNDLPLDFKWNHVAQLNWFFSNRKGCFAFLLLNALIFCRSMKMRYGILQMKKKIVTILNEKGLSFVSIPNASLKLEHIPHEARGYYLDKDPTHLYYMNISDNIASLQDYLTGLSQHETRVISSA